MVDGETPTISPEEATQFRDGDDGDPYLLDIRDEDSFNDWHIPGAANYPVIDNVLEGEFDALDDAAGELPEERRIVTVCVAGKMAQTVAKRLRDRHGLNAVTLEGGMQGWARVHRSHLIDDGLIQVDRPGTGCLSYVVHDGDEALVVDPTRHITEYVDIANNHNVEISAVVDTHAHADHVSGGPLMADRLDVPYYLHPDDRGSVDSSAVVDGDVLDFGWQIEAIHTPGHTPGSICLCVDEEYLLTGDTLFLDGVGRPDLNVTSATADTAAEQLCESLARLRGYPENATVLPGHSTSADVERPVSREFGKLVDGHRMFQVDSRSHFVDEVTGDLPETPDNYELIKAVNRGERSLPDEDVELGPNNCASR